MSKIYIVEGCEDYESSSSILAFNKEEEAEKFKKKCEKYQQTVPRYDYDLDDSDFKLWDEYETKLSKWSRKHPAKYSYDSYWIREVELV